MGSLKNDIVSNIFADLEKQGIKVRVLSQEQTDALDMDLANGLRHIKKEYEIKERNSIAYVNRMETYHTIKIK